MGCQAPGHHQAQEATAHLAARTALPVALEALHSLVALVVGQARQEALAALLKALDGHSSVAQAVSLNLQALNLRHLQAQATVVLISLQLRKQFLLLRLQAHSLGSHLQSHLRIVAAESIEAHRQELTTVDIT